MLPALRDGDIVLCRKRGTVLERGDLVVLTHPLRPDLTIVKRVIGLAQETISIEMGEVMVDGRRGVDTWGTGFALSDGEWAVPPSHTFLLSDNRQATRDDSRHFGPVPTSHLRRVWWRVRIGAGADQQEQPG